MKTWTSASSVQQLDVFQAVADIAGIAVEPQQDRGAVLRHPPAVQAHPVFGLEVDLLILQPVITRGCRPSCGSGKKTMPFSENSQYMAV